MAIVTSPRHQLEALLFSSGKPMSTEQLSALSKLDKEVVSRTLAALKKEYASREGALMIFSDEQGWRMSVRDEHLPLVKNIVAQTELTRACMETLAVIAYKHPNALQSEVVDTRGGGAYEHIAELERLGFVRKEPSGRSYKLKLTEKFFEYFDVAGEKDIRSVFKGVKLPTKETQAKLGEMEVVPVEEKPKAKALDGMDVVDVEPAPEKPPQSAQEEEEQESAQPDAPTDADAQPQESAAPQEDSGARRKFLDDLDQRIAQLSQRNDERAKEMARPLPQGDATGQDGTASPAPVTAQEPEKKADDAPQAPAPAKAKRTRKAQ